MEFPTVIIISAISLSVITSIVIQFGLKITTTEGREKMVSDARGQFKKERTEDYKSKFMFAYISTDTSDFIYRFCRYDDPILSALIETDKSRARFKEMHDIVYPTKSTKSKE